MSAERRRLEKSLPGGCRLVIDGGHYDVLKPDGTPLRTATGLPIKISASPSDVRTRKNEIMRIRRALRGS